MLESTCETFSSVLKTHEHEIKEETGFTMTCHGIQWVQVHSSDNPGIKCTVNINCDYTASVYVHRKCLPKTHQVGKDMPDFYNSVENVKTRFKKLSSLVCLNQSQVWCSNHKWSVHDTMYQFPICSVYYTSSSTELRNSHFVCNLTEFNLDMVRKQFP